MFQGQIREIPLLRSGKLGLFLVLALFFYPSLPKIGHFHPVKKLLFRINVEQGHSVKKVSS